MDFEKAFENIELCRDLMRHEGGTKFYDVISLRPLSNVAGEKMIDIGRDSLILTRWGKMSQIEMGGAFGEGKLAKCNNSGYRAYHSKIVSDKSARGYGGAGRVTNTKYDKSAFEVAKKIGILNVIKPTYLNFFKQFGMTEDGLAEFFIEDGADEVVPTKIQKVRSPLFGSW